MKLKFLRNLFILGDIGYFNNNLLYTVNNIKNNIASNDAIVLLGDNFYPSGINSECDLQIINYYNIFKDINQPIYSILGNHDYLLNPKAQINNTNWIMDNFYYKKEFQNVELYFIDTVQFNIHTWVTKEKIEHVHKDKISNLIKKQINWLDNELSKNKKEKIIIGHYPLLTNGYYYDKMYQLHTLLIDIFKKHKIKTFISGHEHNIQFIKRIYDDYTFNQVIIGSSAENRDDCDMSDDNDMLDKSDVFYGKLSFQDGINISYIDKYDIEKYNYKL